MEFKTETIHKKFEELGYKGQYFLNGISHDNGIGIKKTVPKLVLEIPEEDTEKIREYCKLFSISKEFNIIIQNERFNKAYAKIQDNKFIIEGFEDAIDYFVSVIISYIKELRSVNI